METNAKGRGGGKISGKLMDGARAALGAILGVRAPQPRPVAVRVNEGKGRSPARH